MVGTRVLWAKLRGGGAHWAQPLKGGADSPLESSSAMIDPPPEKPDNETILGMPRPSGGPRGKIMKFGTPISGVGASKFRPALCSALLASVLLAAPGIRADDRSGEEDVLEQLLNTKVSTASRYLQTIKEAPAAVTIISGEEIRRYGFRTLAEALNSISGFFLTDDRNYTYLGVRGFGRPSDYTNRVHRPDQRSHAERERLWLGPRGHRTWAWTLTRSNGSRSSRAPARLFTARAPCSPS